MDSITLLIVKKFEENTNSEHVLLTTQCKGRKHPHTFSQLLYFKYLNVEKQLSMEENEKFIHERYIKLFHGSGRLKKISSCNHNAFSRR